jgi:hypothetical protein
MAVAQLLNRQEVVLGAQFNAESRRVVNAFGVNEALPDLKRTDLDAMRITKVEIKALRDSISVDILNSLRYRAIAERFEEVGEVHRRTFTWVLEHLKEDPEGIQWDDFVDWLENGDGLYWIYGKAGCGKSTLMKFIYNHPSTDKYLQNWKGDMDLHTYNFFFRNSGGGLQKSQGGLLRSLLYDILGKVPELIPILFPAGWGSRFLQRFRVRVVTQ